MSVKTVSKGIVFSNLYNCPVIKTQKPFLAFFTNLWLQLFCQSKKNLKYQDNNGKSYWLKKNSAIAMIQFYDPLWSGNDKSIISKIKSLSKNSSISGSKNTSSNGSINSSSISVQKTHNLSKTESQIDFYYSCFEGLLEEDRKIVIDDDMAESFASKNFKRMPIADIKGETKSPIFLIVRTGVRIDELIGAQGILFDIMKQKNIFIVLLTPEGTLTEGQIKRETELKPELFVNERWVFSTWNDLKLKRNEFQKMVSGIKDKLATYKP